MTPINFETFTHSGKIIDTSRFCVEDVDTSDIAWHLAGMNRYHNATLVPFSVAEHSMFVADIVRRECDRTDVDDETRREYITAGLLHDAHEYLTGDVIRPYKRAIDYQAEDLERRLDAVIAEAYGIDGPLLKEAVIRRADSLAWQAEVCFFVHPEAWPAFESWGFSDDAVHSRIREGVTGDPRDFCYAKLGQRALMFSTNLKNLTTLRKALG